MLIKAKMTAKNSTLLLCYVSIMLITFLSVFGAVYFAQDAIFNSAYGLEKEGKKEQVFSIKHVGPEPTYHKGFTPKFTVTEIELLERIVTAESQGESLEGKIAVVNVILNRVDSENYPGTVEEVIFQRGQFNPTWDGSLERVNDITPKTQEAVGRAIDGQHEVPSDTLFFMNQEIAEDFTVQQTRQYVKTIGNHTFFK
ncbi:cell wall hydrolase [Proteinivorax tanatarense]|uniref:Cell wall hydrolase n=1 Tax=Proteinivorax tanatarense TaxID=1260629 RepID=A0AAU7VJ03_9FIRM